MFKQTKKPIGLRIMFSVSFLGCTSLRQINKMCNTKISSANSNYTDDYSKRKEKKNTFTHSHTKLIVMKGEVEKISLILKRKKKPKPIARKEINYIKP